MLYIKARVQDQFWGNIVNIFSFFLSPQKLHRAAPSKFMNAHFPMDSSTNDQYQHTHINFQLSSVFLFTDKNFLSLMQKKQLWLGCS